MLVVPPREPLTLRFSDVDVTRQKVVRRPDFGFKQTKALIKQ